MGRLRPVAGEKILEDMQFDCLSRIVVFTLAGRLGEIDPSKG
jgi:hypothetical protein